MTESDLLERIARTLRKEIGPAVVDEYSKTQAFMAAVVMQKLGHQLALAEAHAAAMKRDLDALLADLDPLLPDTCPQPLSDAITGLAADRDEPALAGLVTALYETRTELGEARFTELLARVRKVLRDAIDRRVVYSA